jgi:hypothetical protein
MVNKDVLRFTQTRTAFLTGGDLFQKNGDSHFFTNEELRFLMKVKAEIHPVTNDQLKSDKQLLSRDLDRPKDVTKSQAQYLLRAIEFWELYFDGRYEEWEAKFEEALRVDLSRSIERDGSSFLDDGSYDDGYESGENFANGEESSESDNDSVTLIETG